MTNEIDWNAVRTRVQAHDLAAFKTKIGAIQGTGVAQRAAQYLAVKAEIDRCEEEFLKGKVALQEIKCLLEGYFEKALTDAGAQNIVTPLGTVHWNTRVTASLEDAEVFMDFVKSTQNFDLIERRASATAAKDYAEKNNMLPPGVKLSTIRTIGVNKPGAKAKRLP
jgi:hypothetical protein